MMIPVTRAVESLRVPFHLELGELLNVRAKLMSSLVFVVSPSGSHSAGGGLFFIPLT